ncbi:hypothetical protein PY650_29820 [Rhizobium calliandrae]|uniref:Uncharacterized protein n=1 Tax=Rhizobium calliandrae TaxID=1312182 RepID=A0ABT7KP10_9HYPH|nr:hypothetical protein [Rhizobium calliandrae]MDL2409745.1 hypothetical protein [Rhizobium calliandrae]
MLRNPDTTFAPAVDLTRRTLLRGAAALGDGLLIGIELPSTDARADEPVPTGARFNAFIHIAPDDKVTFTLPAVEMGKGVYTSQAQCIAEELDDWTSRWTRSSSPLRRQTRPFTAVLISSSRRPADLLQQWLGADHCGRQGQLPVRCSCRWRRPNGLSMLPPSQLRTGTRHACRCPQRAPAGLRRRRPWVERVVWPCPHCCGCRHANKISYPLEHMTNCVADYALLEPHSSDDLTMRLKLFVKVESALNARYETFGALVDPTGV